MRHSLKVNVPVHKTAQLADVKKVIIPTAGPDSDKGVEKSMLETDLPIVNDVEGKGVPAGLPAVMDAHVHIFPDPVFFGGMEVV